MLKQLLVFILLLAALQGMAQRVQVPNLTTFDDKKIHFGYTIGLPIRDYSFQFYDENGLVSDVADVTPSSAKVGLLANIRLAEYFDFRINPCLTFGKTNILFSEEFTKYSNGEQNNFNKGFINFTSIEIPFLFKYKAKRIVNQRPYLISGVNIAYELTSVSNPNDPKYDWIRLDRTNYFVEVGMGWDIYYQYFKFAIELKYSLGLNNSLYNDFSKTNVNDYDSDKVGEFLGNLKSLRTQIFTISFHFE